MADEPATRTRRPDGSIWPTCRPKPIAPPASRSRRAAGVQRRTGPAGADRALPSCRPKCRAPRRAPMPWTTTKTSTPSTRSMKSCSRSSATRARNCCRNCSRGCATGRAGRPSLAAAAACMRTLHTFKGGARLAGAMRLGEMAHRLETAIEHLLAKGPASSADVEALLTRVDAITSAFELLGRPVDERSDAVPRQSAVVVADRPGGRRRIAAGRARRAGRTGARDCAVASA